MSLTHSSRFFHNIICDLALADNPEVPQGGGQTLGVCWENVPPDSHTSPETQEDWQSGSTRCNALQRQFTYAVVEKLHNLCAGGMEQWDGGYYYSYKGECNERGLFNGFERNGIEQQGYLAQIQAWYFDPTTDLDGNGDLLDGDPQKYDGSITRDYPQTRQRLIQLAPPEVFDPRACYALHRVKAIA